MFIKNRQKIDIVLTSFEGYVFTIPPGVAWIWDMAGEESMRKWGRVESPRTPDNKDKYGFDNGHGVPALLLASEKDWVKDGKKLTGVARFKIHAKLIPRAKMVTLAKQRGVSDKQVMEYLADPNIDTETIAETINSLPVPDEIRYPANLETDNETKT